MEKRKETKDVTTSLKKLDLNTNIKSPSSISTPYTKLLRREKTKKKQIAPSLVNLCLGVVGKHLEDIVADLNDIASSFPGYIKMAIAAIARRRKLLCDEVIVALADSSWEVLDVSGSDVTDSGLMKVAEICKCLRALDISRCSNITPAGVSEIVQNCKSLQTLRCGGCPRSEYTARNCLSILKPKLNHVDGDSWEELDYTEIGHGAASLRWLVWPKIDKDSSETLTIECPRIIVNPKPSPLGFRGVEVPMEAFPDAALDDPIVEGINPETWVVWGYTPKPVNPFPSLSSSPELSMAEKFRLAFAERDERLAPKRAKNARQHQRRAEREWMTMSSRAKAIALASQATKSLHTKN